ncbi:MAG TPA: NUDIX domain-containing protein [Spirochaetota bacterium]|nr:NUDIX domain-containing protein [Spirochaetota bacterium]HOL56276.1 NUDIX domain-containing protein [Spirochaetota bacterium]HPP03708.1 NUDIX domain-containing protein [Spirochaetota bacterium]
MEQKAINVSAAFLVKDKKVLIVQRGEKGEYPLKWEFPGGKLLEDEKFDEALIRELKEELNLDITVIQEIGSVEFDKEDLVILVMFILVEGDTSKIQLKIHKDMKFVTYDELKKMDLLIPDKMFVDLYEKEIKKFIS